MFLRHRGLCRLHAFVLCVTLLVCGAGGLILFLDLNGRLWPSALASGLYLVLTARTLLRVLLANERERR